MEYEYKSLYWYGITGEKSDTLNRLFDEGWEYVHGFSEHIAISGNSYNHENSGLIVIIRRKKEEIKI